MKRLFIVFIVVLIAGLGGFVFLRLRNHGRPGEILLNATAVGTPIGSPANSQIGPAGGSLSSPDGRLTVTVPPNAVSTPTPFVIQPITNLAFGGIGNAYRLEPSGTTFSPPVELSVQFNDNDLKGTIPEVLSLAYQDDKGSWRVLKPSKLDLNKKTVTVSTDHFTDWSFLARVHISPIVSYVTVNHRIFLQLVLCEEPGFWDKVLGRTESANCGHIGQDGILYWAVNDIMGGNGTVGTISLTRDGAQYHAPSKVPDPRFVFVKAEYSLHGADQEHVAGHFIAEVIVQRPAFRVDGRDGSITYSGLVCDLDHEFVISGTYPDGETLGFVFTPSESKPNTGTMNYLGNVGGFIDMKGSGTYRIEAPDSDVPVLLVQTKSDATLEGAVKKSGGGEARILLTLASPTPAACSGGK